jgi:autotransporter passenger strand-loop-strand repeat protein
MFIQSGSYPCSKVTVQPGGVLGIGCNTQVQNVTAVNGAILHLTMAGEWFNRPSIYDVSSNGVVITSTTATSTTDLGIKVRGFTGWDMKTSGCTLLITDWASAAFVKVSSGCSLTLGSAAPYGPGGAGQIDVYNGGEAAFYKANGVGLATVHSGGTMYLSDVENATLVENGGCMIVYDERIFQADQYYDPNVKIKPNTFKNVVLSGYGQDATAHSGTVASHTTLKDSATLKVFSGGKAVDTVISGGYLTVDSGGVASGVTLEGTKGMVYVSGGGKVTGRIDLGNAGMVVEDGGIIDFDISALAGGNSALLVNYNTMAVNVGNPHHTITVSGTTQAKGVYALATQAASLRVDSDLRPEEQKIFSICDKSGAKIGAVMVGTKTRVGDQTYALNLANSGDLSLTVAAYVEGEEIWYEQFGFADDGWNDFLVDKSKNLNANAAKFVTTAVSASTTDILLDKKGSVSKGGKKNYVCGGDATDFAKITMKNAAKLSLSINATDAAKFTLWRLIPGRGGTYTMKTVQTATLKKNRQTSEYEATTKALLVHEGEEFYVSMQSTNAKKGGEAFYNVTVNKDDSVFFTKGNNGDDWEDLEWMGADGNVDTSLAQLKAGKISQTLYTDWIGFGDAVDYKRIRVAATTKLTFAVEATDAAKFSVCALSEKGGDYSLKTLASSKLAKSKASGGKYVAQKEIVLEAGDYYLCMESTNEEKGGSADYTVSVAGNSFTKGDNSDDSFETAKNLGALSGTALQKVNSKVYDDWVGYQDEFDYRKVTLASAARLRFRVVSDEATVFSVCQAGGKNGALKTLQTTKVTKGKGVVGCEATTKELLLEAGEYYLRMQSANAKKYGSSDYTVSLSDAVFFADGDDGRNGFLCDSKKKLNGNAASFQSTNVTGNMEILVDKKNSVSRKVDGVTYKNFVGFGDETDCAKFTLNHDGKLYFTVTATDAAKFTVCKLVAGKNDTYTVKSLLSGKLTKGKQETVYMFESAKGLQLKAGETYYVCVESTNAKKSEYGAYYNVSVDFEQMDEVKEGKFADALADIELGLPDGGLGSCLFAGLSDAAPALAGAMETGSQSAWRDLASLA